MQYTQITWTHNLKGSKQNMILCTTIQEQDASHICFPLLLFRYFFTCSCRRRLFSLACFPPRLTLSFCFFRSFFLLIFISQSKKTEIQDKPLSQQYHSRHFLSACASSPCLSYPNHQHPHQHPFPNLQQPPWQQPSRPF